jgi:hypothetical protein
MYGQKSKIIAKLLRSWAELITVVAVVDYWGVREMSLLGDTSGTNTLLAYGDNHHKQK